VCVCSYLADQLKLPVVAELTSVNFPSVCVVDEGKPMNAMRMVGNSEVVILLSEFKVVDPELTQDIVEAVFDFASRHHCRNLFTVEGVPKEVLARVVADTKKKAANGGKKEEAEDDSPPKLESGPRGMVRRKPRKDPTASMSKKELQLLMSTLMYLTTDEGTAKALADMGHIPLQNAVINGTTGTLAASRHRVPGTRIGSTHPRICPMFLFRVFPRSFPRQCELHHRASHVLARRDAFQAA